MNKFIGSIYEKICLLIGILIFSQFPLFIQNYVQQLSGRVHELHWQIDSMRQMASQSNKTLEQYIHKFLSNDDADFISQGKILQETVNRWNRYSEGLFALEHATVWSKPLMFLRYFDWNIVVKTYDHFEPGFTLNLEGIVFACIGMACGSLFYVCTRIVFRAFLGSFKRLKYEQT